MQKVVVKLIAGLMCAFLLCISASSAFAVEFFAEDELYLTESQDVDVYAAGGIVSIEEDIEGDLYTAGGLLTINGNIEQDLVAAGGQITINGDVGDDLRVGGGSVVLNGSVGDHVVATGGNLNVSTSSLIGGDLIIGNGYANILGTVNGDLKGGGGKIVIGGAIYGDVIVEAQDSITLTENAQINGNLIYKSLREAQLKEEQVAGFIEFNKRTIVEEEVGMEDQIESFFSRWHLFFQVFKYLALLVIAVVLVLIAPACLTSTTKTGLKKPWKSLGLGFVVLICSIAAMIVLSITVLGLPLAFILLGILIITLYVARVYAALLIGNLLIRPKKMTKLKLFGLIALGAFIISIISIVPFVGWLISFVIHMIAFGAFWMHKKELYDKVDMQKL